MSIPRNTSIRIRIISGWAMRKYRVHKRGDYITACVWFFTYCRALTLIRNSENTLGNCSKIILLSNLDIWDSLKIGRSILCGRTKNSCIIQKWTLHLHSQSRKFLKTRDNKPLRRVARQHTWGAFSITYYDSFDIDKSWLLCVSSRRNAPCDEWWWERYCRCTSILVWRLHLRPYTTDRWQSYPC